jgi:LmbE family N-acetylglucosaminyl deacetylase
MRKLLGNRGSVIALLLAIIAALVIEGVNSRADKVLPDVAFHFLKDVMLPQQGERVLVFSPHPDDETIGAGGYIIQSVRNGAQVMIVLVTNGNKHGLMNRRYHEFREATSLLGVPNKDLLFLNLPDGHVSQEDPVLLAKEFENIIRDYNPEIVIYPDPQDQHPDHAFIGDIMEKIMLASFPKIIGYQYLVHHKYFPQPKKLREDDYLLPPSSMVNFDNEWERLELSSEVEDQKLEAVFKYTSQLRVPLLRSLLLSLVRRNELFAIQGQNNA